jgi:hypothetical protein
MDVPDPNDQEVMQFAATATLEGSSDDENAAERQFGMERGSLPIQRLASPTERR